MMTDPVELNLQRPLELDFGRQRAERSAGVASGEEISFSEMLSRAVERVDQTMKASDQSIEAFIAGETDSVHEVMISMQRAQVSFQLMVEIRNKAIETWYELSRMQI